MRLHLIIPVLNEAPNLQALLPFLLSELSSTDHITVADGGSTDGTAQVMAGFPQVRHLLCSGCGRARQMNEAAFARLADYDTLYFLHADTRPPAGFREDIQRNVHAGYPIGCYRFRFDSRHPLLYINSFFTRFAGLACRGGDQSLYLTREVFTDLGGYRNLQIMEDYDIIQRAWTDNYPFRVIPRSVTVSARKYRANNWLKVQMANLKVFRMYKAGAPQRVLVNTYRSMLKPW